MAASQPPTKHTTYDLTNTFDVIVGKETHHRFTVYTDVLTSRSEFFRAARSSQWLTNPTSPTDLSDEDPKIFSPYLNCVYFGLDKLRLESLESHPEANPPRDDEDEESLRTLHKDIFEHSEAELAAQSTALDPDEFTEFQNQVKTQMEALVNLYVLADMLKDVTATNGAIE